MRLRLLSAAATASILNVQPSLAHEVHGMGPLSTGSGVEYAFDPAARDAWLADCRQRLSAHDSGLGGALIGGVAGGFAGNRIAGRGDRAVGTFAGAAVGAAAGSAIDRAEDAGPARDECEAYLEDYYARYTQGAYYPAQGYMSPRATVFSAPRAEPECTETIEYVYEDVAAPRKRHIPRPSKIVPYKRVPIN